MSNLSNPRPYQIGALIQWLNDNNAGPHIVLQNGPLVDFPPALRSHSTVTFNISFESVVGLNIDDDGLSFSARFNGKEYKVFAPLDNVVHLHSRNGEVSISLLQGAKPPVQFTAPPPNSEVVAVSRKEKPKLSVIQGGASNGVRAGKLSIVVASVEDESSDQT